MLTPDKLREKSFQTTGRGSYRAEDVDNFLDEVTASYEQMFKENGDLIKKISILAKKVEEYRADEESLKLALLNAQKLADKIVADAKDNAEKENETVTAETKKLREEAQVDADEMTAKAQRESKAIVDSAKAEAEKIVSEANRQSNEILGNINRKVTHESLVFDMIQKEASEFKSKLVAMYKEHINLINQLPELADEQLDSTAPAVEEVTETPAEEETAEVYTEEAPAVETVVIEEEPEEEVVIAEEEETAEAVYEEEDDVVVIEDIPEYEEAPAEEAPKAKPFKLDFSKIDFAEDENEFITAPEPIVEITEDAPAEDSEDDGASSISFKNFFRKK